MTWTGLETFDTTVQKTDIWLKEIMAELNTDSRRIAYMALRSVLLALRDRLTVDEAADLGSQLPLLIRGIYYDEWVPKRNPIKDRHLDEFLARIQERYNGETDIRAMTRAVFKVLKHKVTEGEIKDVKDMMPDELKELWS